MTPPAGPGRAAMSRTGDPRPGSGRRGRSRLLSRTLKVVAPLALGAGAVAALATVWSVPSWTVWVFVGMSVLTWAVYAKDKAAARSGRWRTPESTLHLLAVLGGWPGALLAQQVLRHKTVKSSFRGVFRFTVVANLSLLAALCSPAATDLVDAVAGVVR